MKFRKAITSPLAIGVLFSLLSITGIANAEERGVSVATRLSTLGVGLEFKYPFHEKFNGRLVINQFKKSINKTRKGNRYRGDLKLSSYGVIGDWHPTGGGFRLSAGVLYNGNGVEARTAGELYEFGAREYAGNASAKVDFNSLAPYVGLGWSSQKPRGWSFDFEVGALFQGAGKLSGRGTATSGANTCNFSVNDSGVATVTGDAVCAVGAGQDAFAADIEAEHRQLKDDLDDLKVYPFLALGIQYRF